MRNTYLSKASPVPFPAYRMGTRTQVPTKIVVHRQGNPGAEGENGISWMARTGAASIHHYVDDGTVFRGIPEANHAFHVLEGRRAGMFGLPTYGPYGRRGDYDTIGIEVEDEDAESTALVRGQTYGFSQESRITLVLLLADILRRYPRLKTTDIITHSDLDPWTRPLDPGDAINMTDLRLDVQDVRDGNEPWRTVGATASGKAAVRLNVSPPMGQDDLARLYRHVLAGAAPGVKVKPLAEGSNTVVVPVNRDGYYIEVPKG